ncbi:23S rRNA (guanosine(2251)-2'-O)-methyltransferase RlmB [bacterium]|nr:23S rRNA (guanosine(2251)-2'-O)-methyltransferase RlmB [bacterium]
MPSSLNTNLVFGRRSVAELLSSGLEVNAVYVVSNSSSGSLGNIIRTAEKNNIQIIQTNRYDLDRMTDRGNHQGIAAKYKQPSTLQIEDLLNQISHVQPKPILILDGIEDPRNFGAIIRSAEVMGAGGIIFRNRRAVGLTPTVVKASSGAALYFPLIPVTNLNQSADKLKEAGYWIYGLDSDCETDLWDLDMSGQIAFVVGSEGKGISQYLKSNCDKIVRIPQAGKIASLNASVSVSIALAEWLRQSMRKM